LADIWQSANTMGNRRDTIPEDLRGVVTSHPRSPVEIVRLATYVVTGSVAGVALAICAATVLGYMPWAPRWGTDWFLLALLFGVGPFAYFKSRDVKRIELLDEKFPDFLRDMAESARAGMTLPRALVTASKGSYGALTPEIRLMSAQVEWGVGFSDALTRFADRTASPLVRRIVSLIIEARRSGGNVVDVLTAAADDARELRQIVQARHKSMQAYAFVVYVTYAVFIFVVLILQAQFLPAFKNAVSQVRGSTALTGGGGFGGISFNDFDLDDYRTLFFHASILEAITGGLVAGVLRRGNMVAGFRAIVVMLALAWVCFRLIPGV
jgi:flagellar protein FlaJ